MLNSAENIRKYEKPRFAIELQPDCYFPSNLKCGTITLVEAVPGYGRCFFLLERNTTRLRNRYVTPGHPGTEGVHELEKEAVIRIEYIPISEIKAYENNPRDNAKAVDAVIRSMKKFGVRSPAIVDKDNVLIAGHTRILAAIKMGMTEFPCVKADDLTQNQAKAFRLADNRMQEDSEWDSAALAEEFAALKNNGFDLSDTGFEEFEIESITCDFSESDPEEMFGHDEWNDDDGSEEMIGHDEWSGDGGAGGPSEIAMNDGRFTCIICCHTDEDRVFVKELIGESYELKNHYTIPGIRKQRECECDDCE